MQGIGFRHWVTKGSNIYAACSNARWSSGNSAAQGRPEYLKGDASVYFWVLPVIVTTPEGSGRVCLAAGIDQT